MFVPTLHCDFSAPGSDGKRHTKFPLSSVVESGDGTDAVEGTVVVVVGGVVVVVVVVVLDGAEVVVEEGTVVVVVDVVVVVVVVVPGCLRANGKYRSPARNCSSRRIENGTRAIS